MSSERKIAANRYNGRKGRGLAALGNGNAIDSDAVDFLAAMICDEDQNMGGGPGDRPQRARFASYLRAANRTHRTDADTIALAKRDSLARRRIAKPMQHVNKSKFSFPKRLINTLKMRRHQKNMNRPARASERVEHLQRDEHEALRQALPDLIRF
jgi:septal ring factor EnvC (AmiA/AmiB activator)